ncbi:hypothetical protein ACHAWX_003794 [Stephanocyclus meneghinianus]
MLVRGANDTDAPGLPMTVTVLKMDFRTEDVTVLRHGSLNTCFLLEVLKFRNDIDSWRSFRVGIISTCVELSAMARSISNDKYNF